MNPIRLLARLLLFLTLSTLTHAADLPRVAVVSDSPEPSVAAFADFLSVSLASASNQYTLVERAELTKLASEAEVQKLAADQRPAALAKLAKADGLIIVGADKGDPKLPKVTLRLTSTNNGLILRSLILGGKENEYPKAAELAAGVLHFPCERLAHGDAKPPIIVSLLGIRPAFEIDRALETTLNLAVAQQLSAQSGIAVSERWRMNDLVFERSLADEKPQFFATGTVLLDGSYTRKRDEIEITLRLRKAESETGRKLELKGNASKTTDLAQQIARLVATASGQSGEVVAWDALKESKQYADLGWWLYKRNISPDSIQAFEVAMALGQQDGVVLRGRLFAYQRIVDIKDGISMPRTSVDGWVALPKGEFRHKLMMAIRMTRVAIETLEAKWGGESFKEYSLRNRKITLHKTLDTNMKVLQALCLRREQLELATEARTLRALCRQMVAEGEANVKRKFSFQEAQLLYMFDTPGDAAADLRSRLLPESIDLEKMLDRYERCDGTSLRQQLWQTCGNPDLWRFVDWTSTDNAQGMTAWMNFIRELQGSNQLLNRIDGLALAYQSALNSKQQQDILAAYCKLIEDNYDEMLTPEGQSTFRCFSEIYSPENRDGHPEFDLRILKLLTRVLESGAWLCPATLQMFSDSIGFLCITKKATIPEAEADNILRLLDKCLTRAKSDPRWNSEFCAYDRNRIAKVPESIILAYPNIKARRIKPVADVKGAVPILSWKPELQNPVAQGNRMFGEFMVSNGESLMIPTMERGLIDLNIRTMAVSRIIEKPLNGERFIGDFAATNKLLMMIMDNRLFITPLSSDGKTWKEIYPSGVTKEDRLLWLVEPIGDDFFVGSYAPTGRSATRMFAGIIRNGNLEWLASSSRRPAVNRLDEMDPRNTRFAYRNLKGGTMVMLEDEYNRAPLFNLDTGQEVSSATTMGHPQRRGDMKLYWCFSGSKIDSLIAFDPAADKPTLMIHAAGYELPGVWKGVQPVYDGGMPEFRGESIAAIIHGGKLWILKREPILRIGVENS